MSKKEILIGLLILIFLAIFIKKDFLFKDLPRQIINKNPYREANLRIALNTPAADLSEYSLDLNSLIRTANVYEGLVAFDRNLKIIPALAVSWGNTDNLTWGFKLRQGVKFHDQKSFDANSVKQSFENAQKYGGSAIKNILSTIKEIKIKDSFSIQIITSKPDPLLLSKLTKFYIGRPNNSGTGPYKILKQEAGKLSLTGFSEYWGRLPIYQNAEYIVIKDKNERQQEYAKGTIDILAAVPKEQMSTVPQNQIKTMFSMEANFLMFNLKDPLFSDISSRNSLLTIFDPGKIESIGNGVVRQLSQFIPPGVYGHNPEIRMFEYTEAKRARDIFGEQKKKVTLDYPSTYKTLAEYLKKQLDEAGFITTLNPINSVELLGKVKKNESQLFILGWQSDNGDAQEFFDDFCHSKGTYNNGRYSNSEVDKLIEQTRQEVNPGIRLENLKKISKLVHDDLIGIPLFESSRMYAVKEGIGWDPRMDGLVLALDVK